MGRGWISEGCQLGLRVQMGGSMRQGADALEMCPCALEFGALYVPTEKSHNLI